MAVRVWEEKKTSENWQRKIDRTEPEEEDKIEIAPEVTKEA